MSKHSEIAQFVILDVGIPTSAKISEAVLTSLSNLICLSQGGYIPAVGLGVINATYQQIFRLSSTQSSPKLLKILEAIKSIKDAGNFRARISVEELQDYIHLGIKTALDDIEALQNQSTKGEVPPEKVQITIFSMKNLSGLPSQIEAALPLFKLCYLSKIQIIELVEDYLDPESTIKAQSINIYLEYLQATGNLRSLDELMKQRLLCCDIQQEHLTLVVQDLFISCYSMDCLLRPSPLSSVNSEQESLQEPVEEEKVLEVIQRIPTAGVCETHMFGCPVLFRPRQCQTQLSFEEHEALHRNRKYFLELCSTLETNNEYFVAKYERRNKPVKFILLMPGAGFMLAKELVSAEIAIPVPQFSNCTSNVIPPEIVSEVATKLLSLPSVSSYNPRDFSSGLYEHLLRTIQHATPTQQKKEALFRDPSYESVILGIKVKSKTKLKRKNPVKRQPKSYSGCELPQLTETDQLTLADCFTKQRDKGKLTSL